MAMIRATVVRALVLTAAFAALAGDSVVALAGDGLLPSPRHVTGVNAAAKTAVSTSARTTVARIICRTPDVEPFLSECL